MSRTHPMGYIRVKFHPNNLLDWYAQFDSSEELATQYATEAEFLSHNQWILKGNRKVLEKNIEQSLGRFYATNWIIRHVNFGNAYYY